MFQFSISLSKPFDARRKLIACQLKSIPYHNTHGSTSHRAINAETMSFEIWGSLQHDTPQTSLEIFRLYNKFSLSFFSIVVDNDDNVNEHLSKLLNQLTALRELRTEKKKTEIMKEGKWEKNAVTDNRRRCLKYRVCAIISTYTCCCVSFFVKLKSRRIFFLIKQGVETQIQKKIIIYLIK